MGISINSHSHFRGAFIASMFMLGAWAASASDLDSLRVMNGQRVHEVERKETLYGIARAYNLDVNALLSANPAVRAEDGLHLGQILILPKPIELPDIPAVVAPDAIDQRPRHTVVMGETLYGIARQYDVTVESIESANPALSAGLQPGDVLRIPADGMGEAVPRLTESSSWQRRQPPSTCQNDEEAFRVLALMPFQFDADTLTGGDYPVKVIRLREVAMEMYQGMLWAAQELVFNGIPVILDVRDSEPDSLGRHAWNEQSVDSSNVVMGPLRRTVLDSALAITSAAGKPHWILTPQPASLLASHEQALLFEPIASAALEKLGAEVANNHPKDRILVLELAVEAQQEQEAFLRGFREARTSQGLAAEAGLVHFEVSTRFATGAISKIRELKPACVVVPSGSVSRAMVSNFQTELQLADEVETRIYLHPGAADYQFLERKFFDRFRVSFPTQSWMNWSDSLATNRVRSYRDDLKVEPGPYAQIAYEAVLESARWCDAWAPLVPPPLFDRFDWSATGLETGFVNRAWRIQQHCHGEWIDGSAPCSMPKEPASLEEKEGSEY